MAALILLVFYCDIPNPNMILIAGLVLCSALFGYGGGIVAAVIMLGYTLFFFSTDHSFTQFTPQNMQKVMVSIFGIVADMLLVCELKRAEIYEFNAIHTLNAALQSEAASLDTIHEMLGSGKWTMDFDEQGVMVGVKWSDEFRRMLGYHSREDFPDVLESWSDLLHPDDKERVLKEEQRLPLVPGCGQAHTPPRRLSRHLRRDLYRHHGTKGDRAESLCGQEDGGYRFPDGRQKQACLYAMGRDSQ